VGEFVLGALGAKRVELVLPKPPRRQQHTLHGEAVSGWRE
jgi:hypothetical protein